MQYRLRYDAPGIGTFVTRDSAGYWALDLNLYRYCGGNPANRVDPSGEFWGILIGAAIGAVSGAITGYVAGGWQGALAGGVGGAVGGAVAGALFNPAAGMAVAAGIEGWIGGALAGSASGAAGGLAGGLTTQTISAIEGNGFSGQAVGTSTLLGMAGGSIFGGLGGAAASGSGMSIAAEDSDLMDLIWGLVSGDIQIATDIYEDCQ